MQLTNVKNEQQMQDIRDLYDSAFPANERKPFEFIIKRAEEGDCEVLAIEDESGIFFGMAITILYQEFALLDYFAIVPQCRKSGIGSQALQRLLQKYADRKFILEIESADAKDADYEQRVKRKSFYLKNGLKPMGFQVTLFGVDMEVMTYQCTISFAQYYEILSNIIPEKYIENVKLKQETKM